MTKNTSDIRDPLTGMLNRQTWLQGFGLASISKPFGLFLIRIERMETINQLYGVASGDRLLQAAASLLAELADSEDALCRFGGTEFMLRVPLTQPAREKARIWADRILQCFRQPVDVGGREVKIDITIGISLFPEDGTNQERLLWQCRKAMKQASQAGRNYVRFYDAGYKQSCCRSIFLENGLYHALKKKQFFVHYQPQMDVTELTIHGAEALVRWQHPDYGLVSPAEFIPLAEESGMIVPMGQWVLEEACRQMAEWRKGGIPLRKIAVNLSIRQLEEDRFDEAVSAALSESGLDPECLELEITETFMQCGEAIVRCLHTIREMGVTISLDDFGTGYSNFSHLHRFPLDVIKLDRSFLTELSSHRKSAAIIRGLIDLAHSLGMQVTAEGVETEEQLRWLHRFRCDLAQGYLIGKPMTAEQLKALFA